MSNRLAREKSPYLLQHKENPVDWYPWGEEAFQKAKRENKPIFLSIGYSTCYWCHMMEKDSFERQDVAELLNKSFISVKVDREEHPDVDQIYMDAVVAITGQGGWPMSVFLTPDLKPFFGGTFFWRQQFMQLIGNIAGIWEREPEKVLESAKKIMEALTPTLSESPLPLDDLFQKAFDQLRQNFDPVHGGFGSAPKFPQSMNLFFLLSLYRRNGSQEALTMATQTLDAMAKGEIYDRVGGGFHRYATQADWREPHYEKMLYDNALLALTYLEASLVIPAKAGIHIAQETLDYVLREMTDAKGGFYSAQDAGEAGAEGEYYHWTEKTVEEERMARAKRPPPHIDDKIVTSLNGLMIAAMAKGYQVLKQEKYLKGARGAAYFVQKNLFKEGKLLRRFREGDARFQGTLDDYAFLIYGLLALHEVDTDSGWKRWAEVLQKTQDDLFWDQKACGYYFTSREEKNLIVRKITFHDGALPSGNAISALNLLRLSHPFSQRLSGALARAAGRVPFSFASALLALLHQNP